MKSLKVRFAEPLFLAMLCLTLPLMWLTSPSMRAAVAATKAYSWRRKRLLVRLLARKGAEDLGGFVLIVMFVAAAVAGGLLGTVSAFVAGAAFGFVMMALVPVMLPMPSAA